MTHLTKLTFKTVTKSATRDLVMARRDKLVLALREQKSVVEAAVRGEDFTVERSKWIANAEGERVLVKTRRRIRPWFFEQDGGWYVQCRYGARVLAADGKNNAVFVKTLKDVDTVLDALIAATSAGELDAAIAAAADRKSTKAKAANNG